MEKIVAMAKVTSKGSTTVPVDVRSKLKIKGGDSLIFIEKDGEIIIRKA